MAKNYQVGLVIKGNAKGGVSAVKATKDELTKLNTKQKRFQQEATTSKASIGGMTKEFGLLKGVVAGVSFGLLANEVYRGIDAFQGYRGQLKTITGDFSSAGKELERLIAISKETPFTLAQSVEGFTKLTHLGLDPSRESMISYGNTAAAMGKDLMQMIEAVADASVGEFERLKEFGIKASSQGDKVRFTFQGTSTEIKKDAASIQQYLIDLGNNKFGDAMGDQMGRLSAKTSNLQTSFAQLYDGIGSQGAASGIGGTIDTIALGVDGLSSNLPAVISVIETLSVVAGGHLVAALAKSSKGMLDNKIASLGKLQANIKLQASELMLAKSANHKAIQEQLAAKRSLTIAKTTYARTRALNNLALANGKAAASERILTVATNAHNVAMNRASVTSRLLGGSMALLGGPVGVAMLAGYALYEMASGMDSAKSSADKLKESTDKVVSSIENMTRRQQELKAASYKRLIDDKTAEIIALGKQAQQLEAMDSRGNNKRSSAFSSEKRQEAAELSAELSVLQEAYGKLQENLVGVNLESIKWSESSDSSTKSIASLSKESQSLIDRLNPLAQTSRQYGEDMKQLHSSYLSGSLNIQEYKRHVASLAAEYKNSTKSKDVEISSDQKFINSLKEKIRLSGMGEVQKQAEINLSKLSINATDEQRQEVEKYTNALADQKNIQDEINAENDFYQNMIAGANGVGEAWASAGNIIVDTFGSIGQQMENLFVGQEKYNKAIEINHQKQKVVGADLNKLKKEEAKLDYGNTQAQLNSYSSIAGAASSMFKENSKAAKAFHAIEQGLAIASLAMSVKKMLMSSAETTAVVANETVKQAALGTTAIINQGQGDPYTAWVRIAAMVAVVAGLGIATSGSSGSAPTSSAERQENQGTGTVLGSDDKSASLINSFERIEELELDKYAELREMNNSLNDLNNYITHLATSFVSNFGKFDGAGYSGQLGETSKYNSNGLFEKIDSKLDVVFGSLGGGILDKIIGGFSSTKKSLVDSGINIVSQTMGDIIDTGLVQAQQYFDIKTKKKKFWGLSSSTSYSTQYQDVDQQLEHELALVFGNIGTSINSAIDVLGVDTQKNLDNFVLSIGAMSFKGLSGDEIQAELEAILSSQADLMATYLVPGIVNFQKVGEGLYETLIRLSQEQAVFNSVLEITGNTLANVDANKTIVATQAIIGYAGGIEALQGAASTFFTEFYSEAEQFEYMQKQLNAQFEALGLSVPATKAGFKDLVSALEPLNEADQQLYAQLLLLSGQTAEYLDALENQGGAVDNTIEKEKELAIARLAFSKDIGTQLALLDFSPVQTQLYNLQKQFADYASEAQALGLGTEMLELLHSKKRQTIIDSALAEINNTHQVELDKLNKSHTAAVAELVSANEQMSTSIAGVAQSIAGSILTLKRQMSGWDEVGYQSDNVNSLRSGLGNGDIGAQLSTIDKLSQALQNKYQAEIDSNNQLSDLANERYQNDLSNYQALADAAKNLKKAADDLRFGDLSTFTSAEQFNFSKESFTKALSTGDIANLQGSGQQYLEQAKNYYGGTASSEYQAIFDEVTNAFSSTDAGAAPSVPAQTTRYQNDNLELQNNLLLELESLQLLTDELNAVNADNLTGEMATLADRYDEAMAGLNQQLQAQTAEFVHSITNGLNEVVGAINNIEIPAIPAPVIVNPQPIYLPAIPATPAPVVANPDNKLNELVELTKKQTKAQAEAAEQNNSRLEAMEMRFSETNSIRKYAP